ncbi:rCG61670 [Rattus norvegicus]|uniref:RCG61670 n=1 Tax=Rattus norvegicus TaxID=10116 RepID=A6HBJ7_RAT|nr:rCG61670 [Rattus norvegicus]
MRGLTWNSLIVNGVEPLSLCSVAIYISLSVKCLL